MDMRPYIIEAITGFPKAVTLDAVVAACARLDISPREFCDSFAKQVAREFVDGSLSWRDADVAMNALSGFFFEQLPKGTPFPDYAFGVFQAFDVGETEAEPEHVTRAQLACLYTKA